jgi:hypothetical protein
MNNTVAPWEKRCVYLTHTQTRAALERHLTYRVNRQLGASLDNPAYRGLMPSNRHWCTEIVKDEAGSLIRSPMTRLPYNARSAAGRH